MYKSLTARQREIVQLLAEGKSSKELALVLAISVKTAETHRVNIMRRLGMHSVSQLVRFAVKNYIIEPQSLAEPFPPLLQPLGGCHQVLICHQPIRTISADQCGSA